MTNISIAVRTVSSAKDCNAGPAGLVAPRVACDEEHRAHQSTCQKGPKDLACDVGDHGSAGKASCKPEAQRHRRVQMGAGDIADGVDHRHDDQAEGQGDADVRDRAARRVIDNNRPSAGEHKAERAENFGDRFLRGCSSVIVLLLEFVSAHGRH